MSSLLSGEADIRARHANTIVAGRLDERPASTSCIPSHFRPNAITKCCEASDARILTLHPKLWRQDASLSPLTRRKRLSTLWEMRESGALPPPPCRYNWRVLQQPSKN